MGVSAVFEHTERAVRARGDCPIVNRSRMVSLFRTDNKSVRDNNSKINKKMCYQIYLGGR